MSEKPTIGRGRLERLSRALTVPAQRDRGEEMRRQHEMTVIFTLSGMAIFAAFSFMVFRQGNIAAGRTHFFVVMAYTTGLAIMRMGFPAFAMYLNIATTAVGIFGAMWFGGGLGAAACVFVATLPVVGFLSLGKRAGIYGAGLGVLVIVAIISLQAMGYVPRQDAPRTLYVKRVVESLVIVVEMYVLSLAFHNATARAYALLSTKRDEVASLLDSMRQGVLAFGADGLVIGEHSKKAQVIFGRDKLEGASMIDLLYSGVAAYDLERELFATWHDSVFAMGRAGWDELYQMAPSSRVITVGAEQQHLRLEARPVFEGDNLTRVMMLVTDETEEVKLRRQVDEGKIERERNLLRTRRLAASGAHTFVAFLESARKRIDEFMTALSGQNAPSRRGEIEYFFGHAHTIRGEARAFDLEAIERPIERIELLLRTKLQEAFVERRDPSLESCREELSSLLSATREAIDDAKRQLVEVSPIGAAILDQVTVSRRDLDALTTAVGALRTGTTGLNDERLDSLSEVTTRLVARPFGELAGLFSDAVQRWAEQRGKTVRFEIEGRSHATPPALASVLPQVLSHLLRNAIAHGIEEPRQRQQLGKPQAGLLSVSIVTEGQDVELTIKDDGAGLDASALAHRAEQLCIPLASPGELIFMNGVSTSAQVDSLSGNGIGMGAVRAALQSAGYLVVVRSEPGQGTCFTVRSSKSKTPMRRVS